MLPVVKSQFNKYIYYSALVEVLNDQGFKLIYPNLHKKLSSVLFPSGKLVYANFSVLCRVVALAALLSSRANFVRW